MFVATFAGPGSRLLAQKVARPSQWQKSTFRLLHCSTHLAKTAGASPLQANPLLQQGGLPLFEAIEPSHVEPAVRHLLTDLENGLVALEAEIAAAGAPASYELLDKIEQLGAPLEYAWGVVGHLNGVKNSGELRVAHQAVEPDVVAAVSRFGQSEPLYQAIATLQDHPEVEALLDGPQRRVVKSKVRDMRLDGVALDGQAKTRFTEIKLRLAQLGTTFSNNVLDATKAYEIVITDPSGIAGLPPSGLALAAQSAASSGHDDATAEVGPWRLTLDPPSYVASMKHLKDPALREQLYRAFVMRASSGSLDNNPLIAEMLTLRREMAHLLEFKCFADLSVSRKMASRVSAVRSLTAMLRAKAYPAAEREMKELRSFVANQADPLAASVTSNGLQLWDIVYWSEPTRGSL